ncbi:MULTISPECIES: hypothetical protein [unclassified Streptomyces]|uniref:hypothetical protein n=1 Tax=unclassified Streptomyces TaxID=2593676 RepID=UPI0033AC8745
MWEQDIGTFPVDFTEHGNEWAHHLGNAMGGGFSRGRGPDYDGGPVEMGPPLDGSMTSVLRVHPHPDGIRCTVVGEAGTPSPDQIEPWRIGARNAVDEIGRHQRMHVWNALVGASPSAGNGFHPLGQIEATDVGPVALVPGGVYMREFRGQDRVDSQFITISRSFPVVVTGQVEAYDWDPCVPVVQMQLRRLCALLTLHRQQLWEPRTLPWPQGPDGSNLKIPTSVGPDFPSPNGEEWTGEVPPETGTWRLPPWALGAWERLDSDPELETALNAYYEAVRLGRRHPSLALLTFVAAIEGVGMRLVPDAMCECHPECTHRKGVAEKRFQKALKTVLTQKQVKEIAGPLYDKRSYTGHRGTLFGSEQILGYGGIRGLFQVSPYFEFEARQLGRLAQVANAVLVKVLSELAMDPGQS